MASDSEPKKLFFLRPPRGPLRSHISGSKKACIYNDSAGNEVDKQHATGSAAAAELHMQSA